MGVFELECVDDGVCGGVTLAEAVPLPLTLAGMGSWSAMVDPAKLVLGVPW